MTRKLLPGLASLFLLLCVLSCARSKEYVTEPEAVPLQPPAALMEPTPEPACDPAVNQDLADCYVNTRKALRKANEDKAALKLLTEEAR
jgi:hypothetical protein